MAKKEQQVDGMVEASMYLGDSFATGYIHQAAWDAEKRLVFARIVGRPAFVRAMSAGLMRGLSLMAKMPDGNMFLRGQQEARALYNRLDKDAGVATYFSAQLFSTDGDSSVIVGAEKDFLRDTFYRLLKRRPVVYHEGWDLVGVYHSLKFLKELDGFGVKGFRIEWNDQAVCQHLGELVRRKKLSFAAGAVPKATA